MINRRDFLWVATAGGLVSALPHFPACVAAASASEAFPPQVEMRVPFAPTAFPSEGKVHLAYELYLTNFGSDPAALERLEIMDARRSSPIWSFQGEQLTTLIKPLGFTGTTDADPAGQVGPGRSVVVFVWVSADEGMHVPDNLRHRFETSVGVLDGAFVGTHQHPLRVLAPPLRGADWLASDGPGNSVNNHHRRGTFVIDGKVFDSRRFGIDWAQSRDGVMFKGDSGDIHSWFSYGLDVYAVADGTIVTAMDGLPENTPGFKADFKPAVPITLETMGGNTVMVDIGGAYAHYFHLQPGSLRVRVGERVKRGQLLARVGGSGDARAPHLHFQLCAGRESLGSEGLPYLVDHYRVQSPAPAGVRHKQLPLDGMIIDFSNA